MDNSCTSKYVEAIYLFSERLFNEGTIKKTDGFDLWKYPMRVDQFLPLGKGRIDIKNNVICLLWDLRERNKNSNLDCHQHLRAGGYSEKGTESGSKPKRDFANFKHYHFRE